MSVNYLSAYAIPVKSEYYLNKRVIKANVDSGTIGRSWSVFIERIQEFSHECRQHAPAGQLRGYRRIPRLQRWHLMTAAAEFGGWHIAGGEELKGHVAKTKHLWECASGHRFAARYDNVQSGHWCPLCRSPKWTIERVRLFLQDRPFICISTDDELRNNKSKLRFQCHAKGHVWSTTLTNVTSRNSGCPNCRMKSEQYVREVFQDLFGEQFMTAYPKWLRRKSGAQLQLDCYSSELSIAVEFQGQQHFQEVKVWQHGERELRDLQRRDALKRRILQQRGIMYVEIPYFPKDCFAETEFKEHVLRHIPSNVIAWARYATDLKVFRQVMTAVRPTIFDNTAGAD